MSGVNVNDPPIDLSLFPSNNSTLPPQQTSQRPKPRPLLGQHRRVVPSMSTAVASAATSTAVVSYQPLTPPPSQPLAKMRKAKK